MKRILPLLFSCLLCCSFTFNFKQLQLDERAKKYYSQEDYTTFPEEKIASLNYFFRNSYRIEKSNPSCKNCTELDINTFDVKKYDKQRKDAERVTIYVSKQHIPVILFSWNEVRGAVKKIIEQYNQKHENGN